MITLIAFYAFYGIASPINKILAGKITPLLLVGLRGTIAGLLLYGYRKLFSTKKSQLHAIDAADIAQIIFFYLFLSNVLRYWALQYLTSIKTSLLYNFSPFITYLFAYISGVERMTTKKSLGLCIGFFGFFPLLLTGTAVENAHGTFFFFSWPELAVIIAAACDSYGLLLMSKLMKSRRYEPLHFNSVTLLCGGILSLVVAFIFEKPLEAQNIVPALGLLSLVIFISSIVSYNVYLRLLKYYSATFLSLSDFLRTIFATLYGCLFLSEALSIEFFISATMIFIGLFLFYKEEIKENPTFVTPQLSFASNIFKNYKESVFKKLLWWKKQNNDELPPA